MYDLEISWDIKDLRRFLDKANREKYIIVSLIKESGGYTVLYKTY